MMASKTSSPVTGIPQRPHCVLLMISFLVLLWAPLVIPVPEAKSFESFPMADGLSWKYYSASCPPVEFVVRGYMRKALRENSGLAAALLRMQFHDCFVQGCDASLLLTSRRSEQSAPPNLTLPPAAFVAINQLRDVLEKVCGRPVVSCADIVTLAARDAVFLSGGPLYPVPLGRKDSLTFATPEVTVASLPSPLFNGTDLLAAFARFGLDVFDLVSLSGAHTIGVAHCPSFTNRLYPTKDPTMDADLARVLYATCPTPDSNKTRVMDPRSPTFFDNAYYVNLARRQGLFTSDQALFMDARTSGIVQAFAVNPLLFFHRFASAMVKMGQIGVLTGNQGEVRANCSVRNHPSGGAVGSASLY